MIEQALKLALKGFSVLPLRPRSKLPLTRHAYKDASNGREKIAAWFGEKPDANIGVATGKVSNIVVIDIDGESGAKTLAALEAEYGQLHVTLTATTARGKHFYFRYPADRRIPTSKLGEGIDLKSDGGYCCAPPSIHPDGTDYKWIDPDAEIQPLPAWVPSILADSKEKNVRGERQDALRRFACEVANKGASPDELREAVHLYNKEKCRPQKPAKKVDQLVDWILKHHSPTDVIKDFDLDWFAFNCKKFFGDWQLMTLKDYQLGWWTKLQAFAWMNKGVLPSDPDKLARLAGAEDVALFKSEKDAVLFEYELVDGQLVNHKMAAHWQEKQELTRKRVKAGKARAEKARKAIPEEQEQAA